MTIDAETRDCIRDLCLAVAELAARSVHLLGTDSAQRIVEKAGRLSHRMDELDARVDWGPSGAG